MCLGIPGRLVEPPGAHPDIARVDVEGVVRDVNIALLEDDPPRVGEWVLIHLGFALQRMTEAEVAESRATLAVLGGEGDGASGGSPFGDPFPDDAFRRDTFAPPGYTEG
jgi:hydrogenase expression/formation protein HypC